MTETFVPEIILDRESPVPLYEQIAAPIEHAIRTGQLPAGAMIEDEVSMAQRLDVARPTARRALQELTNKGLVTRRRGIGTRVTPPHVRRPMKLSSLYDDLLAAGLNPSTKVLGYEIREATEDESVELGIEPGEGLLHLTRLRYADGHPLALMTNLLPLDAAPSWGELGQSGLYECLRQREIVITAALQEVGARAATEDEAEILDEPDAAPVLTMRRVSRTHDDRVVELGTHVYRPSMYSFRFSFFPG